jgi:hypothetical protein
MSKIWQAKARVMIALEALKRLGHGPGEAAEMIAEAAPTIRKLAGAKANKSPFDKILLNWRREFSRDGGIHDLNAALLYEEGIRIIDELHRALEVVGLSAFAHFNLAEAINVILCVSED